MKRTLAGAAIAALALGLGACSSADGDPVAATTSAATSTVAMPDDAKDQAGVACVAALGPKVDEKSPTIRNHRTQAVADTFVTTGLVSKYVGGEAPHNYQFECTTRFDGAFTAEVTGFTELARTTTTAPDPVREVPYTITDLDSNSVDVTVDATDMPALQFVFDKISTELARKYDEGGWTIAFNCSTGGGQGYDNRIANGKFALGTFGYAKMGLDLGETELVILPSASCP